MLINLRHKLVAHMDIDAATGGFRVVWRTISNGSQSVTAVTDFSAQATGIAGPKDKETADAIRDHTTAVASHLERAVQSAARKLAELAISDGLRFFKR